MINKYFYEKKDIVGLQEGNLNIWYIFNRLCYRIFEYAKDEGYYLIEKPVWNIDEYKWGYPDTPPLNHHTVRFTSPPPDGIDTFEMHCINPTYNNYKEIKTLGAKYHSVVGAVLLAARTCLGSEYITIGSDGSMSDWRSGLKIFLNSNPDYVRNKFDIPNDKLPSMNMFKISGERDNVYLEQKENKADKAEVLELVREDSAKD